MRVLWIFNLRNFPQVSDATNFEEWQPDQFNVLSAYGLLRSILNSLVNDLDVLLNNAFDNDFPGPVPETMLHDVGIWVPLKWWVIVFLGLSLCQREIVPFEELVAPKLLLIPSDMPWVRYIIWLSLCHCLKVYEPAVVELKLGVIFLDLINLPFRESFVLNVYQDTFQVWIILVIFLPILVLPKDAKLLNVSFLCLCWEKWLKVGFCKCIFQLAL